MVWYYVFEIERVCSTNSTSQLELAVVPVLCSHTWLVGMELDSGVLAFKSVFSLSSILASWFIQYIWAGTRFVSPSKPQFWTTRSMKHVLITWSVGITCPEWAPDELWSWNLFDDYLPNTHSLMNADMTMIVLKVLTQSFGKRYLNKATRIHTTVKKCMCYGNHRGRESSVEFCGFRSLRNLQRWVHPQKEREGGPRQGVDRTEAEKHEFAVFPPNDTQHTIKGGYQVRLENMIL